MNKPLVFETEDFVIDVEIRSRDGTAKTATIDVLIFNDDYFNLVKDIDPDALKNDMAKLYGVYRSLVATHVGLPPSAVQPGVALRIAQACFDKVADAKKKPVPDDMPGSAPSTDST